MSAGQGGIAVIVTCTVLMIIAGATFAGADWTTRLDGQPAALRAAPHEGLGWPRPRPSRSALPWLPPCCWWRSGVSLSLGRARPGHRDEPAPSSTRSAGWSARGPARWRPGRPRRLRPDDAAAQHRRDPRRCSSRTSRWARRSSRSARRPVRLWSLCNNVFAWIQDGVRVFDDNIVCAPARRVQPALHGLAAARSGSTWASAGAHAGRVRAARSAAATSRNSGRRRGGQGAPPDWAADPRGVQ